MAHPFVYDVVGKEFTNNDGYKFKVKQTNVKNKRNQTQYICKFESGWTCYAASSDIRKGKVKDMLSPTVLGVGMLGFYGRKAKAQGRLYFLWLDMLCRCYNSKFPAYKWYGGNGVTVCERWKRFDFFMEDVFSIPGFDRERIEAGELELDKDLINPTAKIYSPETCSFVTHRENLEPVLQILNDPNKRKVKCID